jgi:acyl-[acyl-carrier-protein] desaturase
VDPSAVVKAIAAEVAGFEMPGAGIAGYRRKAMQIAMAGIYDLRIHHDEVVWPLLRHWRVFEREGLDAEAEQAREELRVRLDQLDGAAARFEARRSERSERAGPAQLLGTS